MDEAHERSLNIDFLIGYLKRLLPKRRDLKLIITSATIDAARFSAHFATPHGPAPVVEVSGRTFPVEVRWRPPMADEDGGEPDLQQAVLAAVEEVAAIDQGDILIFMPTERHIHETAKTLRGRPLPGDPTGRLPEILPLYARLSMREQQRVFQPGRKRRVVIATNVAESSLTVPRIRYVIDPGTARISRYSPRSKTQRLPIEADLPGVGRPAQGPLRADRAGHLRAAVQRGGLPGPRRLHGAGNPADQSGGRHFADQGPAAGPDRAVPVPRPAQARGRSRRLPNARRAGRAGRQGRADRGRPPVEPPAGRPAIWTDDSGRRRGGLPARGAHHCRGAGVQDPRERPLEKQEAADACHALLADAQSDFVGYLKLWDFYHKLKSELSRNQLRKACRQNFLSFNRMREWLDVHRELMELARQAGLVVQPVSGCRIAGETSAPQA